MQTKPHYQPDYANHKWIEHPGISEVKTHWPHSGTSIGGSTPMS